MKKTILGFVLALFASACGGSDGGGDGLSCADAFLCAADCRTDACVESCMDDATPSARRQMIALATCYEEAGCEDAECIRESCPDEADACGGLDELKPVVSVR